MIEKFFRPKAPRDIIDTRDRDIPPQEVLTPYGETIQRLQQEIESGREPSFGAMRFDMEMAGSPALDRKGMDAQRQFARMAEKLDAVRMREGEDAMLRALLRYIYQETEYRIGSNSLVEMFDTQKPGGNCEGRAISGAALLEELGYTTDRIAIRSFTDHLQLLFQDEKKEWKLMEGNAPEPAEDIPGTVIDTVRDAKRKMIGLVPTNPIKITLPETAYHPGQDGAIAQWLGNASKRITRFIGDMNSNRSTEATGLNASASAVYGGLLSGIRTAWSGVPKIQRQALKAVIIGLALYAPRVSERSVAEDISIPEAVIEDMQRIQDELLKMVKSIDKRMPQTQKKEPNKKDVQQSDREDSQRTISSEYAPLTDSAIKEVIEKGKTIFSASDLVLHPPKGLEQPTPDTLISFYKNVAARTFELPSEVTRIDKSFWKYLFSDVHTGIYQAIEDEYLKTGAVDQSRTESVVIDITATGITHIPYEDLVQMYDGMAPNFVSQPQHSIESTAAQEIQQKIENTPITIYLNGNEICSTVQKLFTQQHAESLWEYMKKKEPLSFVFDFSHFKTIDPKAFEWLMHAYNNSSLKKDVLSFIIDAEKIPNYEWSDADPLIDLHLYSIDDVTYRFPENMKIIGFSARLDVAVGDALFTTPPFAQVQKLQLYYTAAEPPQSPLTLSIPSDSLREVSIDINNHIPGLVIQGVQSDSINILLSRKTQKIVILDSQAEQVTVRYSIPPQNNIIDIPRDMIGTSSIRKLIFILQNNTAIRFENEEELSLHGVKDILVQQE